MSVVFLSDYQDEAYALGQKGLSRRDELFNWVMGLTGETGELVDLLKKNVYHSHPVTDELVQKITKELGDVQWYLNATASFYKIPLFKLMAQIAMFTDKERKTVTTQTVQDAYLSDTKVDFSLTPIDAVALGMVAATGRVAEQVLMVGSDRGVDMTKLLIDLQLIQRYIIVVADHYNITFTDVVAGNLKKLRARYPQGFSAQDSINRKGA